MNMDRNTVIGFVLLGLLLFAYLFTSTKNSQELQAIQELRDDSIARVKKVQDSIKLSQDTSVSNLVTIDTAAVKGFNTRGKSSETIVENELIKVVFSNKGGQPRSVELKKYKQHDGAPVFLNNSDFDKFSYPVSTGNGQTVQVADLLFEPAQVSKSEDGTAQEITFKANGINGEQIIHRYKISQNSYLIDWKAGFVGADKLFNNGSLELIWQSRPLKLEKDVKYERQQTNVGFEMDGDFDYIQTKNQRTLEKQVKWVSVCQQFFNTTLVAKNDFISGDIQIQKTTADSVSEIADITTKLKAAVPLGQTSALEMQLYFGPTDYEILKKMPVTDMDKLVNLGRDMYTFVRPINKYIMMPVFHFLSDFVVNFGIVIALLTIFIRVITSPLVYSSYLSGAKMKALKPEIDKLKAKFSNDQQQFGMEQMKLFREAGVNPLGGCIPALLQIPIFFALYSFFNSNIALRGQSFLWSDNLASYDSILNFPFNIWGLGSHLSLFTLTAAGTSFLNTIYNTSMTPDQNNPAMKYMPYFFPFMLLFIFNSLPSALTWYYTVSNVITFILQFIIQKYVINHDKILADIEVNRKKPKTKSKWQMQLEQMQANQKKTGK